ncbi:MAG: hypothetical protein Q4D53_06170 [Leptotrichiaceae bacterium]|nr:hypothetical protein [Leptotrichiaceae bacterium]
MNEGKKLWYKKWWGIILIILFWVFLVPVVIYQSKISKTKKIMFGGIYALLVFIFL